MATITYMIVNGTWTQFAGAPYTSNPVVKQYDSGATMNWRPDNVKANDGWSKDGAYWTPYDPYNEPVTGNATFVYNIVTPVYTITYEIVNGTWTQYAGAPYTSNPVVKQYDSGAAMNWRPDNVKANDGWSKDGAYWTPYDPYNEPATDNATFVYSMVGFPRTVTYKIVNGTWADGTTTQKTETVYSGLTPANIPEGMIPLVGYKDGGWVPDPYNTVITEDTTFTYECIEIVAIRLIAKKEISSNYMDEDAIATISTSGTTYLNQGDIIYMYGKLVAEDQNEVIMVIHGPTA